MIAAAPASRAFDALVVCHAVVAIGAFVVLLTLRAAAVAAATISPVPPGARRSFTGRREIAGRIVHVVPLTGLGAVAASRGAVTIATPFVLAGLALWLAAAASLEAVGFPAQREAAASIASGDAAAARAPARRMRRALDAALIAIAVAAVVMVVAQG